MPPDDAATVASGSAAGLPQDGPHHGAIVRSADGTAAASLLIEQLS